MQRRLKTENEPKWDNGGGKNDRHKNLKRRLTDAERLAEITQLIHEGGKKARIKYAGERDHLRRKLKQGETHSMRGKGFSNPNR